MQEFLHVKPGKGSAFVRSKLKNLETGNTLEKTWKAGESFADAQVDKEEMQYSYMDGARVDPHPLSHRQSPLSCPAPRHPLTKSSHSAAASSAAALASAASAIASRSRGHSAVSRPYLGYKSALGR